ncbi:MAG: hypothetical protein R2731_15850 [Nocardioides sp.]
MRKGPGLPFVDATITAMTPGCRRPSGPPSTSCEERARAADLYWIIEVASRRGESPATYRAF